MEISPKVRIIIQPRFRETECNYYCLDSAPDRNSKKLVKGAPVPIAAIRSAINATGVTRKSFEVSLHPR